MSARPGRRASDERSASNAARARRKDSAARGARIPPLPDPSKDVVLRPHSVGALIVELVAAAVGLVLAIDGLRHSSAATAVGGLVWAVVLGGGGLMAFRRSTRLDARGVTISRPLSSRRLVWSEVQGFEVLPHQRGRRDRIVVLTEGGPVAMPHGDSEALVLRPDLSRQWYEAVVDRLEAVRRGYV